MTREAAISGFSENDFPEREHSSKVTVKEFYF